MGDETLKRLLDAETGAKKKVSSAKDRARNILESAKEEASRQKELTLGRFQERREKELTTARKAATVESISVQEKGEREAADIDQMARVRIKAAVEKVVGSYID